MVGEVKVRSCKRKLGTYTTRNTERQICTHREPTALPAVNGRPAKPWDMKAMHKLIVMSAVYRQSSRVTKELSEIVGGAAAV